MQRRTFTSIGVAASMMVLAGCGNMSRWDAQMTGVDRKCVAGVSYLQFPSGVSVEYTPEGKVKTC